MVLVRMLIFNSIPGFGDSFLLITSRGAYKLPFRIGMLTMLETRKISPMTMYQISQNTSRFTAVIDASTFATQTLFLLPL